MVSILLICRKDSFVNAYLSKISCNQSSFSKVYSLDDRVIKLSISVFRSTVVVITSIAILAVDFPIFPQKNIKTDRYGFGLMDVGVGYFIICHSMRLIRNSSQIELDSKSEEYSFRKYNTFNYLWDDLTYLMTFFGTYRVLNREASS